MANGTESVIQSESIYFSRDKSIYCNKKLYWLYKGSA